MKTELTVADLAGVVYSSGKVFDGLSTGRLDTENFLRSGSLEGVTSRSDLALLQDLRDVAQFIIDSSASSAPIDAEFVMAANACLTRSGALHPGVLRTAEQNIGVQTTLGRHAPVAMTATDLQQLIQSAASTEDPEVNAIELFLWIARAQPFMDGNKRTAVFVANAALLKASSKSLLTIPVDEHDPSMAARFNAMLARWYVLDEHGPVADLLAQRGLVANPAVAAEQ